MSLKDLNLPESVTTTSGSPVSDFFIPVLKQASEYDVAVGFFTTNWVRDAAAGIAQFACNGGKSRWIVSPKLNEADYEALKTDKGIFDPEKVDQLIITSFDSLYNELQSNTRTMVSWLIAEGILQFKIGIPVGELGGDLHAKMGIFRDSEGNELGFSGSYNLTGRASSNWERIDLFFAWEGGREVSRTNEIRKDFEAMWEGNDKNLAVYEPSDRAYEKYISEAQRSKKPYGDKSKTPFSIPEYFLTNGELRPYQKEAINEWFQNNGRGIFNMATGSGKTVTALSAVTTLANHTVESQGKLVIVIAVPYKHLADQWENEAKAFGFDPIKCYGASSKWVPIAQDAMLSLTSGSGDIVCFVTVNASFSNPPFQQLMEDFPPNFCLIADEMHNLGAGGLVRALPTNVKFRLGLSATPVRHGDEQGTKALEDYFGRELINFSLKDAIDHDFLCRYYYYPVAVPLTDDEMTEYKQLSLKIASLFAREGEGTDGPSDHLKGLLIKRARLIGMAENKLTALVTILSERKESSYNIVYCGDASDGDERHVEKTMRLIGRSVGMKTKKFTADETPEERQRILSMFGNGDLQTLVAIRCLDEGVDVPKTETAYILASSTNPRQFIQRRGRVLRKSPGKRTATIFDFIALPRLDEIGVESDQVMNIERNLVKRELIRVNEFAEMAINFGEALGSLRDIKKKLHLMDM